MPLNQVTLFLETPRAGGEMGHRWLVPQSSLSISEVEIAEWNSRIEMADSDSQIITARRKVGQIIQGNTRDGWETLVVAGLPPLDLKERESVTDHLNKFLDNFNPDRVDWTIDTGLVVPTEQLDDLYVTLQSLTPTLDQEEEASARFGSRRMERTPQKQRKMKKLVIGILIMTVILWAGFALLTDRNGDTEKIGSDDPIWNSFLALRDESFRDGKRKGAAPIEDAKYFWENVMASKWKGGDFLRTDLTRNSPMVVRFLELKTPEKWYLTDEFYSSDEASELRAILKAVESPSDPESRFFGKSFVMALASSSEQLINSDLSDFDPVAAKFLESQKAKLEEIVGNRRLSWPTPADGRRAVVLFETISELSRAGAPQRRIRTWDELFLDEIGDTTILAAGRKSDPVAAFQWQLMKPLIEWASSKG